MANDLVAISGEIANVVAGAERFVAAVHARPRFSSSGVFWKPGVLVTAEHSVRREEEIHVTLPDGKTVSATLAGADPRTDIAVLSVESGDLPAIKNSQVPRVGELALAIGRSQDSGVNATLGIISAVSGSWRTWRGGRLDHYIRLDLTMYPNSSGGLVVNAAGEIIGIATTALSRIAGLAIPASTVSRVVEEIVALGRVSRPYVGVGLQPVQLSDNQKGLIVLSVGEDSPAARAGVLVGDVLVSIDTVRIADTEDVQTLLDARSAGHVVEVGGIRGGEQRLFSVTIGERPGRR